MLTLGCAQSHIFIVVLNVAVLIVIRLTVVAPKKYLIYCNDKQYCFEHSPILHFILFLQENKIFISIFEAATTFRKLIEKNFPYLRFKICIKGKLGAWPFHQLTISPTAEKVNWPNLT